MSLVKFTLDGRTVEAPAGMLVIEAAKRAGRLRKNRHGHHCLRRSATRHTGTANSGDEIRSRNLSMHELAPP